MKEPNFVLAFYPTTHGFAFVLFEGPQSPFDWGVRELRGTRKNARTLKALKKLIDRYRPQALVIENTSRVRSRRVERIRRLHRMIRHLAKAEQVDAYRYTRSEVRARFASVGAIRKDEIAEAIATVIPAFAHRLPPKRKIWMSEDPRQSLFDAAALGLTYYGEAEALGKDPS
jgi:hypothetical protein